DAPAVRGWSDRLRRGRPISGVGGDRRTGLHKQRVRPQCGEVESGPRYRRGCRVPAPISQTAVDLSAHQRSRVSPGAGPRLWWWRGAPNPTPARRTRWRPIVELQEDDRPTDERNAAGELRRKNERLVRDRQRRTRSPAPEINSKCSQIVDAP